MASKRGAPRVTDREDPLTYVLRNRPAEEFLEQLRGQPLMVPLDLRKSIGLHPETFRRLASNLNAYSLIEVGAERAPRGDRARPNVLRRPSVKLSITPRGTNVLAVALDVRRRIRARANLLPAESQRHWLAGTSRRAR